MTYRRRYRAAPAGGPGREYLFIANKLRTRGQSCSSWSRWPSTWPTCRATPPRRAEPDRVRGAVRVQARRRRGRVPPARGRGRQALAQPPVGPEPPGALRCAVGQLPRAGHAGARARGAGRSPSEQGGRRLPDSAHHGVASTPPPVSTSHHELHPAPPSAVPGQVVHAESLLSSPPPAVRRNRFDWFGNRPTPPREMHRAPPPPGGHLESRDRGGGRGGAPTRRPLGSGPRRGQGRRRRRGPGAPSSWCCCRHRG